MKRSSRLALAALFAALAVTLPVHARATPPASKPLHETILYSFSGQDGASPASGLIADSAGALYGTTSGGGGPEVGIVFRLAPAGDGSYTESVLYAFHAGLDGANPAASLIMDSTGNLFGTTEHGGSPSSEGCGTIFELTPTASGYAERIVHTFHGQPDGCVPDSSLTAGDDGVLYGTTSGGGRFGRGSVFALTPSGSGFIESVVVSLGTHAGGSAPVGGVIRDGAGDLFGVAGSGGANSQYGTAFELQHTGKQYRQVTLVRFHSRDSGAIFPKAGLVGGANGALFGTTYVGGGYGVGVVYELQPSGSGYQETTLYTFGQGGDGSACPLGNLIIDASGALFGSTNYGGPQGGGTVFELSPKGQGYVQTVLHTFGAAGDGAHPVSELLAGKDGALYGTTYAGGASGLGTVFELSR